MVSDPDDPNDPGFAPVPYFNAMVEALDTELGRLLASMTPAVRARTNVIFVADNGTKDYVIEPPFPSDHGKGTMYEVGLNVPLIVQGPMVAQTARGGQCDALVGTVDFHATVVQRLGLSGGTIDSYSLEPYLTDPTTDSIRPFIYSDKFKPNQLAFSDPDTNGSWQRAIRDDRYKLIRRFNTPDELYDLDVDPHEGTNLLDEPFLTAEQADAYDWLTTTMGRLLDS